MSLLQAILDGTYNFYDHLDYHAPAFAAADKEANKAVDEFFQLYGKHMFGPIDNILTAYNAVAAEEASLAFHEGVWVGLRLAFEIASPPVRPV